MFSHIMVGSNDIERSKTFYTALLGTLGAGEPMVDVKEDGTTRLFYMHDGAIFAVSQPIDGGAACAANGGTIGFACDSPEQANAWYKAGLENGGTSIEDPPGVRESGLGNLYLAYLRDPDGNKLCALHRMA